MLSGCYGILSATSDERQEKRFTAAQLTEKNEKREHYCRLAVMTSHRKVCHMFCFLHPDRFEEHSSPKLFKSQGVQMPFYGYYYPPQYNM